MAEAVGLAASVIALVDITAKIGVSCLMIRTLWKELKEVPGRLDDLVIELKFWESMLRQVEKQINGAPSAVHYRLLEDLNLWTALGRCRSRLLELKTVIDNFNSDIAEAKTRRQRMRLMKKFLCGRGRLDILEQKVFRSFKLLQALMNTYKMSAGMESMRAIMGSAPPVSYSIENPGLVDRSLFPYRSLEAVVPTRHTVDHTASSIGSNAQRFPPLEDASTVPETFDQALKPRRSAELRESISRSDASQRDELLAPGSSEATEILQAGSISDTVSREETALLNVQTRTLDRLNLEQLSRTPARPANIDGQWEGSPYAIAVPRTRPNSYRKPRSMSLSFRPRWLELMGWPKGKGFKLSITSAHSGWQLSFRPENIVEWWDDDIYGAILRDDIGGVGKCVQTNGKLIYGKQDNGWALLHLAARLGSTEVCAFLVSISGGRFNSLSENRDWTSTPWAFACLSTMGEQYVENYLGILQCFDSRGEALDEVSDFLHRHETLLFVISNAWSSTFVRKFRDRYSPDYHSLPLTQRLMSARLAANSALYTCPVELFMDLLPEAETSKESILQLSRENGCAIIHSTAFRLGKAAADSALTPEEAKSGAFWHQLLQSTIDADKESLHHVENVTPFTPIPMYQTPLISLLQSAFEACLGSLADEPVTNVLREWLETLSASGVNLLVYGHEEQRLYKKNQSYIRQRFVGWHGKSRYRVRLVGLVYGNLPRHWSLRWVKEDDGFAEDFWNLVDPQDTEPSTFSNTIPGEWKDEPDQSDDDSEDVDDPWEWADEEEERPLVWTEYRRQRQPIAADSYRRHKNGKEVFVRIQSTTHGAEQPGEITSHPSNALEAETAQPSKSPTSEDIRRKAERFMKFWKRQR